MGDYGGRSREGCCSPDREGASCCPQSLTFVTGLQVILNRAGERLIDPPLLSEDVSFQAPQDGAYLRIRINERLFVTIPSTERGRALLFIVSTSSALYYIWLFPGHLQLDCEPFMGGNLVLSIFISQSAPHSAWYLQTSR